MENDNVSAQSVVKVIVEVIQWGEWKIGREQKRTFYYFYCLYKPINLENCLHRFIVNFTSKRTKCRIRTIPTLGSLLNHLYMSKIEMQY